VFADPVFTDSAVTDSAVFTDLAGFTAPAGAGVAARSRKATAPPILRRGLIVEYMAIPFKV
jgi:hypothetical protein